MMCARARADQQRPVPAPGRSSGGVVLVAHKGRIICDNTLDTCVRKQRDPSTPPPPHPPPSPHSRLQLCFEQMKPALRSMLFPQSIKA